VGTEYPCIAQSSDKLNWSLVEGSDVPLLSSSQGPLPDPDILYLDDREQYFLYYGDHDEPRPWWVGLAKSAGKDPRKFAATGVVYRPGTWQQMVRAPSVLRDKAKGRYYMFYDGPDTAHDYWWDQPVRAKLSIGRAVSSDGEHWNAGDDQSPCVVMPDDTASNLLGEAWHPCVRYFDACYYLVAAANRLGVYGQADIYLWTSFDGKLWSAGRQVLDYADLPWDSGKAPSCGYRCSMLFERDSLFLWVGYNVGEGDDLSCRIALYKSELSRWGRAALNYLVRDYEQGGKVILGTPRLDGVIGASE